MCPKANGRRVLIHLPHGYVSYATWSIIWISLYPSRINRLVGETLRSRTLGRKFPCSTCCNPGTEQPLANREAVGWVAEISGRVAGCADPLEKSASSSTNTSYIA